MIDIAKVSVCLITKDLVYPQEVLNSVGRYPFGEILVLTNSDSPYRKHELFAKTKYDLIYYQDDDALCPITEIIESATGDRITVAMKPGHYKAHENTLMTMGLGWGSIIPKKSLEKLKLYTDVYGEDDVYKRETERILTALNWPQIRICTDHIIDLPSAYNEDRLWRQPHHREFADIAEKRSRGLL